jgi:hypothetical protein
VKKTIAILIVLLACVVGSARAQDARGYYEAVVVSADFTIDMRLDKSYRQKMPQYIVVRSSIDCTVSFPNADNWSTVGAAAVPTDNIHVWAGEALVVECQSGNLKIVGANTGKLSVLMVY